MIGEVINILEAKGYFFVRGEDGVDYFAHKSALRKCRWQDLVQGQRVEFDTESSLKGPRIEWVQPQQA